ncbi:hypothetical protein J6590_064998 [Homalodisca vitripennis]|nr:hypothetical protein J6590_064998 [Homalodisca vitripennis]
MMERCTSYKNCHSGVSNKSPSVNVTGSDSGGNIRHMSHSRKLAKIYGINTLYKNYHNDATDKTPPSVSVAGSDSGDNTITSHTLGNEGKLSEAQILPRIPGR